MSIQKLTCICISDTHGSHQDILFNKKYQDCDTFIFAGDWTRNKINEEKQMNDFFQWVEDLDFKHKIIIAGNHELMVERNKKLFEDNLKKYKTITYLQDNSVVINGFKIYGSPYSNEFYNWAFMEYENKLKLVWEQIEEDTDILITHGPAYMCNDKVNNSYGPEPHVGSLSLSERKKELKNLKVHITGHIHEAYGYNNQLGLLNICPCILDERYRAVNKPIKFTIRKYKNTGKVKTKIF